MIWLVGSSRGHAPVVDLCERQAGLDADVELLRFGRVRAVDVLEAPLPQERLGVGGPGWPKAAESAAWHQGAAAASLRDPSGEGCPVLLGPMGSPEQVGGPLERQVGPPELLCVRAAPGVPGEPGANQGSHRGAPGEPGASQGSQGSQGRARALLSMPTHRNSFFLGGSSDPARPRCFFLFL